MVPFYGQGLNCGLEDVRVLGTILEANGITSEKISEDPSVVDPRLASTRGLSMGSTYFRLPAHPLGHGGIY